MIEELKIILDSIGDLSGLALWIIGGFIVYKLIVYLSMTGAIVMLTRLAIKSLHDWATRRLPKQEEILAGMKRNFIEDCQYAEIRSLISAYKGDTGYFHRRHADKLADVLRAGLSDEAT